MICLPTVRLVSGSWLSLLVGAVYEFTSQDRSLQLSAFSFDAAHKQIFLPLCHGATLILRENELWTCEEFNQQVIKNGITVAEPALVYFQQLLTLWLQKRPRFLDGELRLILVGGEAIQPETVRLWQQLLAPTTRLLNIYGPTEATITATSFDLTSYQPERWPTNMPIGRPFPGRKAYVLDNHLQPVPISILGELYIGGDGLARGYLNRLELTAERFIDNPFVSADQPEKLYKTGDVVRWLPDWNIEFIGRVDNQVKIRGYRVELGEIEHLLALHLQVAYAIVLAHDEKAGSKRLVVAYVVAKEQSGKRAECQGDLRNYLQDQLPDYITAAMGQPS